MRPYFVLPHPMQVGKRTPVFVRFSTVGGEKGSADTERDPRGFAVKFYTEVTALGSGGRATDWLGGSAAGGCCHGESGKGGRSAGQASTLYARVQQIVFASQEGNFDMVGNNTPVFFIR
jgi:hypothetical protein